MSWAVLVLQARKPAMVFEPRRAEHGAEIWAVSWVLLLVVLWALLLRPFRVAQFAATPRGGLQLVGARCCSPLAANCYRLRANSAIRRIAVLGRSDAILARGRRAEDELPRMRAVNVLLLLRPLGRRPCCPAAGVGDRPNPTDLGCGLGSELG